MKAESTNGIEKEKWERFAFILKTIAHPTRLAIIELLAVQNEMRVNEITETLGVEQSVISHHLLNMKMKGLLLSRRVGTNVYYSLKEKKLTTIIECVEKCNCNFS
ncbi:MAG TPA: metalloregulator ArsR/SmtB family transcription factor [Cytophagaceae bacterium]